MPPDDLKVAGGRGKAILREAFAGFTPRDIDRRPKTGFGVPLGGRFRGELRQCVRDTLLAPSAASRPYLKTDQVERLIDAHQQGRANAGIGSRRRSASNAVCRSCPCGPPGGGRATMRRP